MRRKEDKTITKHSLNLYAGDFARLQELYTTRVGAGKIIRDIIHAHIRKIEEEAAQKTPLIKTLDVELENQHE